MKDDVANPSPIPSEQSTSTTVASKKGAKATPSAKNAPLGGGAIPFVLHPIVLDIKVDERADLCVYSYPATVKSFKNL